MRGSGGRGGDVVSDGRMIAKLRRVVAFNADCVEMDEIVSGSRIFVVLLTFLSDIVKRLSLKKLHLQVQLVMVVYSVGVYGI